jgi:hypothetical protein
MNKRLKKLSLAIIIAMFLLSSAAVFPVYAGTDGEVKLINTADDTGNFIFTTNNATYDDIFVVRAMLYPPTPNNVSLLWGWQLFISYDTSLLDCLGDALPSGHVFEGKSFNHPAAVVDEGVGTVLCTVSLMSGHVNVSTAKPLTDISFQIKAVPTKTDPLLNCNITFTKINLTGGTYLSNEFGAKYLNMNYFDAYYEFTWVAPTEFPWLEVVDPIDGDHTIKGSVINETLEIDIEIHDCAGAWEMVGVQFRLWYNSSLLWPLDSGTPTFNTAFPDYTPGVFMDGFANGGETAIYAVTGDYHDTQMERPYCWNYFQCMAFIAPDGTGYHAPYPDGDGLLLTLIVAPQLQGLFPEILYSPLELTNILFVDRDGAPINQTASIDGEFQMMPKVLGRKIDVYTQYPYPFGGQGLFQPSDMFWPQKPVILCANVTYNDWPEQQKDVAFQVIDPYGDTWAIFHDVTDLNGVACVGFTMPWPCDDPEHWIGVWTVVATVDIACQVVNDTLWFHYDYLVIIDDVELNQLQYKHCEYINATISYKTQLMQKMNITISMTACDETGVPFGFIYGTVEIGGAIFCSYTEPEEIELSVHVIKWARAGTGTINIVGLTDFPYYGGYAISAPLDPIPVQILAEWA